MNEGIAWTLYQLVTFLIAVEKYLTKQLLLRIYSVLTLRDTVHHSGEGTAAGCAIVAGVCN